MTILFALLAGLVVAAAIGVAFMRNPVHSALCLVANLLGVAGIFAMLDAHFLAVVQVIVYAGAIVVLVLFVLMLLNLKVEAAPKREMILYSAAVLLGCAFIAVLAPVFQASLELFEPTSPFTSPPVEGTVEAIGRLLYTRYVFTFEAASILIMVAIAGAVMMARRIQRKGISGSV